jgi:hypothetical protein
MLYACEHHLSRQLPDDGLIHDGQSPDHLHTIVASPLVPRNTCASIDKWHIHHSCAAAHSVRSIATRDDVLSLGLPAIQERWISGTQTATVHRLSQSCAAFCAMDMLITPVRLLMSTTGIERVSDQLTA